MEGIELLVSRIERRNQPEANIYLPLLSFISGNVGIFSFALLFSQIGKKVIIIRVKQTAFRV